MLDTVSSEWCIIQFHTRYCGEILKSFETMESVDNLKVPTFLQTKIIFNILNVLSETSFFIRIYDSNRKFMIKPQVLPDPTQKLLDRVLGTVFYFTYNVLLVFIILNEHTHICGKVMDNTEWGNFYGLIHVLNNSKLLDLGCSIEPRLTAWNRDHLYLIPSLKTAPVDLSNSRWYITFD